MQDDKLSLLPNELPHDTLILEAEIYQLGLPRMVLEMRPHKLPLSFGHSSTPPATMAFRSQ